MIERLLAADRALEAGDIEAATRLFDQVAEADPRNAIAVVGQARIALRRGDPEVARGLATKALIIDPDEAAAQSLLDQLEAAAETEPAAEPATAAPDVGPEASPASTSPRGGLLRWLRRLFGRRP